MASVLCVFQKTQTAHRAENMKIFQHGPSNLRSKPATFKSQVQRSIDWTTRAPLWFSIGNTIYHIHVLYDYFSIECCLSLSTFLEIAFSNCLANEWYIWEMHMNYGLINDLNSDSSVPKAIVYIDYGLYITKERWYLICLFFLAFFSYLQDLFISLNTYLLIS